MAILVDTSYSMGYGNRLALARRRAAEVVNTLQTGDQVALLTFAVQARVVRELGPDHSGLPALLDTGINSTFEGTDYVEALRAADDQLSGADFDKRTLYLVSDFQQSGWNPRSAGWKLSPGVQLRLIDVGDEQDGNTAVTGVEIPTALSVENRTLDVVVRVRNYGQAPIRDELTLRVNGNAVEKRLVDIAPHSGRLENFRHTFEPATNYRRGDPGR